jgi:hypothetical protein
MMIMEDGMLMNGVQVSTGFLSRLTTHGPIVRRTLSPASWLGDARSGTQAENFCQGVVRNVSLGDSGKARPVSEVSLLNRLWIPDEKCQCFSSS